MPQWTTGDNHSTLLYQIHQHTMGESASAKSHLIHDTKRFYDFGRWVFPGVGPLSTAERCPLSLSPVMGDSALHLAVRCGHRAMIEALVDMGCKTSIRNSEMQTAEDICPQDLKHAFYTAPAPVAQPSNVSRNALIPRGHARPFAPELFAQPGVMRR